jgi:hypothetical protein
MDRYVFPGYPEFLERAIAELGFPKPFARVRVPEALAGLANLCAQASDTDRERAAQILREAASLRDQLLVASRAADLMLDEVTRARVQAQAEPLSPRTPRDAQAGAGERQTPTRPASRPTQHRP